jgi:nitroreductase
MPEKIKISDFEKAISMTSKTPTACNRQMCKIYYIYDEEKRKKVIKYGHGLTNFDLDTVNLFIVTFDISSLCCVGDRHQGWFNSGLVAMNFVNSLHSLGIGSCFIQFGNDFKEENELKDIVDIPSCEKVAVIISAGYYPDENIVPCSTRKNDDDIYKII